VHPPLTDIVSILFVWVLGTGFVTLAITILLIVPSVCLLDVDTLLRQPWRIFVESGIIAIVSTLLIGQLTEPTLEPMGNTPHYCDDRFFTDIPDEQRFLHSQDQAR
jgi:hypothetical protein